MLSNITSRLTPLVNQSKAIRRNLHTSSVQNVQSIGVLQKPGEGSTRTVTVLPGMG